MVRRMGEYFSRWAEKYMPDPFLFAILLSFLTWLLGIFFTASGPFDMLLHWNKGFWELLAFSMQMSLVLVTGYALATTRLVRNGIIALADVPKTASGATYLVALVAVIAGYISWGLAIVVGALMARQVGLRSYERKIPVHYPLLGAAGYAGLAVWHGGFSGSAPLLVATKGHFLADKIGIIPVSETIFSPMNIVVAIGLIVGLPFLFKALTPIKPENMVTIDRILPDMTRLSGKQAEEEEEFKPSGTAASRLEHSVLISLVVGIGGLIVIFWHFATAGFDLNLNVVNFIFLFAGILLHRTPIRYVQAITEGTKGCAGIILQFPFYAGIMGMMKYSGLVAIIAGWFVAVSNQTTYPMLTFISAAIVNIFVPSGGGQWAVQGPIIVEAAKTIGASYPKSIMALAYGDQWTNLFQPFWALALLGITGLKARHIMGYCMAVMLIGFVYFMLATLILPA